MSDDRRDDDKLRDSEIALVDALKLIMEVMVATGTVRASVFEQIFAQQRDSYIAKTMPNAAVIMEVLRGFAAKQPVKPSTPAHRPELDKPPQGSA